MCWKTVRLELARAPGFPNGSASRAYLLHLPVDEQGVVEEQELLRSPALATFRRHWPNERDRAGYVLRHPDGWSFAYDGILEDAAVVQLGSRPLKAGEHLVITEPSGDRSEYKVMS